MTPTRPLARSLQGPPGGTTVVNAGGRIQQKGKAWPLGQGFPRSDCSFPPSSRDFIDQQKPRAWRISGDPEAHSNKFARVTKKSQSRAPDRLAALKCSRYRRPRLPVNAVAKRLFRWHVEMICDLV